MRYIIKQTLQLVVVVIFAHVMLIEFTDMNPAMLNEITKIILISLFIQPWVIYQFTH